MREDEAIGLIILCVMAFMVGVMLQILYCVSLQRAMNAIDSHNRPLPGALVWLSLIPLIGFIWQLVFIVLLSTAMDREFARKGIVERTSGLGIALVVLVAMSLIPFVNLLTCLPAFVLSIMYWVKLSGWREQLAFSPVYR